MATSDLFVHGSQDRRPPCCRLWTSLGSKSPKNIPSLFSLRSIIDIKYIPSIFQKISSGLICSGRLVAPRFPPGFLEMRINDEAAALLDPLTIGARALRKQGHRIGAITCVAYLWFPWKCEFLPPPRMHTISTAPPHPPPSLTSVCTFGAVRVPTRRSLRPNISEVTANKCGSGGAQYVYRIIFGFFSPLGQTSGRIIPPHGGGGSVPSQVMFQLIGCADVKVT